MWRFGKSYYKTDYKIRKYIAASNFSDTYYHFLPRSDIFDDDVQMSLDIEQDPNPQSRQLFDMLNTANLPLYLGCEIHIQMSMIGRMMSLKKNFCKPERLYDEICQMMRKVFPKDNRMTDNFYDMEKQIVALGLSVEKIDCYLNGCMMYWGAEGV